MAIFSSSVLSCLFRNCINKHSCKLRDHYFNCYTYEAPFVAYEDDEIVGRVVPRRIAVNAKEAVTFERFTGTPYWDDCLEGQACR